MNNYICCEAAEGLKHARNKQSMDAVVYCYPTVSSIYSAMHYLPVFFQQKLQNCEEKLTSVTEQLEKNVKLHRDLAHRAKQYETDARDLAGRLHCAEGELAAGDVLRESFKTDKERVRLWWNIISLRNC